jgi:hypothetical protein
MVIILTNADCHYFNMREVDIELDFILKVNELKKENSDKFIRVKSIDGRSVTFKVSDIVSAEYRKGEVNYYILSTIKNINNLIKEKKGYDNKN